MKFSTKNWRLAATVCLLGLASLLFLSQSYVNAKPPDCSTMKQTPVFMGQGNNCAEATADLKSKITAYALGDCPDILCSGIGTNITMACHLEGPTICVLGYGTYQCQLW